jgi:NitT/TauT family transport system substrate-binding protein
MTHVKRVGYNAGKPLARFSAFRLKWVRSGRLCALWLATVMLAPGLSEAAQKKVLRVGHFPNLTHAQGVIGNGLSRAGKGWFEQRLGPDIEVQWFVYNAGPSAMEALITGSVDITYVGPNPAINAHLKTRGKEVRIVAGACSGGAALVVPGDGRIAKDADFKGKKIGTPQLGNTQDVAARAWLQSKGFKITMTGGEVLVVPTANPDQLVLFQKGDLAGVWTVEPWVSRLELEAKGKIFLDESSLWTETEGKYVTTHLVSSAKFLTADAPLLKKFIAAHVELTEWINKNADEAKRILNDELKAETTRALPQQTLDQSWKRLELTYDPISASLVKSAADAHRIGFLREKPDLAKIYDLKLLNEVLKEKGAAEVK